MYNINIIDLNDVLSDSHLDTPNRKYNVNNLYDEKPPDYHDKNMATRTCNWVSPDIKFYIIDNKYHLNWLKIAQNIANVTGKFPRNYLEELKELCNDYSLLDFSNGYFIRTEHCSLKTGIHGKKQYFNLVDIIESIVTSDPYHKPLLDTDTELSLYLFPYLDMVPDKEFRVFVYDKQITGISQQFIYKRNDWLLNKSPDFIHSLINDILDYFSNNIQHKLDNFSNYTFDLVLLENGDFYFIELNGFGANYSAGSALFHWITDNSSLTGNCNLEFRYVV